MTIGVERSGTTRADARLEVAARDVHGAVDGALVELVGLAHVDEDGRLVGGQARGSVGGADLVDLRLQLGEKILVARHVPANATCIAAIPSRLPCARERPASTGSAPCRLRSAGVLVVAVAVVGALRAAQPRAGGGAALVGAADAARRRSCSTCPQRPRGGEAALAAVAADMRARAPRAGRGVAAARARAARRGRLRVQVAGALLRYRPGEVDTAIGVLRALVGRRRPRARARAPPRSRAALVRAARRGDDRAARRRARSIPTGSTGSTADDVLHPSYRKGYPLWVRSRLVRGSLAAAARAGRGGAALAARRSSTTPTASSSARARARGSSRSARSRSTPATSTPRWR